MIFSGCEGAGSPRNDSPPVGSEDGLSGASEPVPQSPEAFAPDVTSPEHPSESEQEQEPRQSYIDRVARDTLVKFTKPDMSEYDRAKAAFDYIIETTSLAQPVGLELWRVRGDAGAAAPDFVENRALSVLLFGVGMCEDYAAALTVLLRGLGLEAEYVPGLTYAANGSGLVDHAWTVAKIDGVWYHIDSQLEDNISKRNVIRYKYFMKGDATMSASHRWGQNLIDSGLLTAEQNAWLEREFLYEACPQDYPTPPPLEFAPVPAPELDALKARVEAEMLEYERLYGPLEPLELDIIPPVFELIGFGPPD